MSKDKGTKNHKKAPADKTLGKLKVKSDYKSESKSGSAPQTNIEALNPKNNSKGGKGKS